MQKQNRASLVNELERNARMLEGEWGDGEGASVEHAIIKLRMARRLLIQARHESLSIKLCNAIDDFLLEEIE